MKKLKTQNLKLKTTLGFTLIEILVSVAIIGVLSALLMVNFIAIRQRGRDSQRKANLAQIQSALEIYRSDNGKYPSSPLVNCPTGSLTYFGNAPTCSVTYLRKVPTDPLGGSYTYIQDTNGISYTLIACLENTNDSQKDSSNNTTYCTGATTNWSYTVKNP